MTAGHFAGEVCMYEGHAVTWCFSFVDVLSLHCTFLKETPMMCHFLPAYLVYL